MEYLNEQKMFMIDSLISTSVLSKNSNKTFSFSNCFASSILLEKKFIKEPKVGLRLEYVEEYVGNYA